MDLINDLMQRQSYLSTKEVMILLQKTRNTLCQWVRSGRLPAIRLGNEYLYDPRVLAEFLSNRLTAHRG
ncbi:MAG: helix-turn-helix domain-containing protein [Acidobacteriaceae bacterium]